MGNLYVRVTFIVFFVVVVNCNPYVLGSVFYIVIETNLNQKFNQAILYLTTCVLL